jgi:hypothetical protein
LRERLSSPFIRQHWKGTVFRVTVTDVKITVAVIALLLAQTAQCAASNACTTPKYEDHNQVDYGPLRLSKIVGLAIDNFGAAVPQRLCF